MSEIIGTRPIHLALSSVHQPPEKSQFVPKNQVNARRITPSAPLRKGEVRVIAHQLKIRRGDGQLTYSRLIF